MKTIRTQFQGFILVWTNENGAEMRTHYRSKRAMDLAIQRMCFPHTKVKTMQIHSTLIETFQTLKTFKQ